MKPEIFGCPEDRKLDLAVRQLCLQILKKKSRQASSPEDPQRWWRPGRWCPRSSGWSDPPPGVQTPWARHCGRGERGGHRLTVSILNTWWFIPSLLMHPRFLPSSVPKGGWALSLTRTFLILVGPPAPEHKTGFWFLRRDKLQSSVPSH